MTLMERNISNYVLNKNSLLQYHNSRDIIDVGKNRINTIKNHTKNCTNEIKTCPFIIPTFCLQ